MYKNGIFLRNLLIVVSLTLFVACGSVKENIEKRDILENSSWKVIELKGLKVEKSEKIAKINFEKDSKIYGNLGCNSFLGAYKTDTKSLNFDKVGSTMMMCQDMTTEQNFLEVLNRTNSYKIEGDLLMFFDKKNRLLAKMQKE